MSGNKFESGEKNRATSGLNPLSLNVYRVMGKSTTPLRADLSYDPADPLFVTFVFRPRGDVAVSWQISRDLLRDGLLRPSGTGDVRIWPTLHRGRAVTRMRLRGRGASALFQACLPELQDWLMRTYELVPPGTELDDADWDAAFRALLDGM
ncbi:SsgA family sporulation/cell division regulator [Streptomyces sp. NPDC003635]